MSIQENVRFAVIGTNWITDQFIEAARQHPQFALTAVYSRTEEKAQAYAERHGIAHLFTDLEAFASSDTFDAVYIASPNSFHAEQAKICLGRGKHVLCEKPIASNAHELHDMIAAAEQSGVVLMEALKSTLLPNFRAIRDHLGKLGTIRRYSASYGQYSSRYDAYKQGTILNAFNPVFSNGSLMDLGVYCLYPLAVLFGRPDQVSASGVMLESGVDGMGSVLMTYGQMEAVISHSKIANSYLPAEIQGEEGTIVIDAINRLESVEIRYRNGSVEQLGHQLDKPSMYYEAEEFIGLITRGERQSTINSHAASLATMEIMDEARRQIGLVYPADRR
ncbi:gfo/Idh/MocA family oxidoreductase [Paenibacillaceae bacterium]|nr:gfo/Idh/MocA family oxidoreductase [Paenibacillaceae bacterium]